VWHALKKEAFHATILDMELAGNQPGAAARRADAPVQASLSCTRLPARDAKTKLHMKVPLHYSQAEEESQAVKFEHCVVNHVMSELDIPACRPTCPSSSRWTCPA
jgi:large subunit ribosomal protein L25